MPSQRKYLVFALLTLSVCALALYIHRHQQGRTGYVDNLIVSMSGSVQEQTGFLMKGGTSLVDKYLFLVGTKEENVRLRREVAALQNRLAQAEEAKLENDRLKVALRFERGVELPLKLAQVIAHDVSSQYFGIRIDQGEKDGIRVGMGVIAPSGLVGRVRRVAPNYSDIVTLLDPTSNIDAVIQGTRSRGIITGQSNRENTRFKYMGRLEAVSVGDAVVSSGFGNIFPKGQLLGYVKSVVPNPSGVLQTVIVKTAVDIYRLEEVFVVFPPGAPEEVS